MPTNNLPDPKNCHKPVCSSKSNSFFEAMRGAPPGGDDQRGSAQGGKETGQQQPQHPSAVMPDEALAATGCPVDREELGRQTWTFLHTMAAYYPEQPTENQQVSMRQLLGGLAAFYPCTHCAEELRVTIRRRPVEVRSREALCVWLCEAHNDVNRNLGKPVVRCTMKNLDRRWRTGRAGCWTTKGDGDSGGGDGSQSNAAAVAESLGQHS